ncbi:MAG: type II toxin-antitoxin system RelE family toxin [Candidatus Loosdrechtia sp.]|uniref:type II toxin-antitoxin system RelE family toxin n=1 Tax=Candidatus Loosdrechtia sp. TaxID=3101272 RepID=UPI003A6E9C8F|nr:MAG: hypothetical protein QY305_13445 [Candidatus Jettenia sp. AMX2]
MEKFKVVFSDKAEKDTDTLSDDDFNRIVKGCKRLEDNPFLTVNISKNSKVMKTFTA